MVQLFLDNLSKNVYTVSSLYIRQVVCNLNIQHDLGHCTASLLRIKLCKEK